MLSLPAVWLSWYVVAFIDIFLLFAEDDAARSMIFYVTCLMSLVWRMSRGNESEMANQTVGGTPLAARIIISSIFMLGLVYLILLNVTLRRYGRPMEEAWRRRVEAWTWEKTRLSIGQLRATTAQRPGHEIDPDELMSALKEVANASLRQGREGPTIIQLILTSAAVPSVARPSSGYRPRRKAGWNLVRGRTGKEGLRSPESGRGLPRHHSEHNVDQEQGVQEKVAPDNPRGTVEVEECRVSEPLVEEAEPVPPEPQEPTTALPCV